LKDFKRYFSLPALPDQVYIALTNEATIQLWTGEPAVMKAVPGAEFSLWDESITGRNLEFDPGKKIVQEWFFGERPEKSIVTIKFFDEKGSTSMEVRQTNIPDEDYDNIAEGWVNSYAGALIEFFNDRE